MGTNGKNTKVISPVKLAHVVLRTRAEMYPKIVDFYKTFLGGTASYENEFLSFITYDDEHHRIALAAIPELGPKDGKTSGLEVRTPFLSELTVCLTSLSTSPSPSPRCRISSARTPSARSWASSHLVRQPRPDAQHLLPRPGRQQPRDAGRRVRRRRDGDGVSAEAGVRRESHRRRLRPGGDHQEARERRERRVDPEEAEYRSKRSDERTVSKVVYQRNGG